jgi:isoleucyl-tRNA synthetase
MPAIRDALIKLDPELSARAFLDGKSVPVTVDGDTYEILPDEVEVRTKAREGLTVASEGAYLCALKTDLTPELVAEGLSREFVRRVQELRKQAEFDIADRIRLYVTATPKLAEAISIHRDYIMGEVLAIEMSAGQPPEGATTTKAEFDGEKVVVRIIRAS